ncbi:hypothetical protein [[Mycobacterium] wendilense]|uniref:Ferredoxin n=1 Tax=[Mycobacterium] wendilense TaxID=3064284 RepID=A0ABM9M939_9MYCO|nr:hypothetical protein [Mycolicibacterium sp. MU0050]CAJ1579381.1 hypothetical protein MU0050_000479 [Mycolicibacterium sp. MU0050]
MSSGKRTPDVDGLARSMVLLHGGHDDHDEHDHTTDDGDAAPAGSWSKAPSFAADPERAAAVRAATAADRERYLTAGLAPVDCRFCHATVSVKKLGPEYTAVQWNSEAVQRCAVFSEARAEGRQAPMRACPKLSDSIKHAIAEGCLEAVSSAPSPGDG